MSDDCEIIYSQANLESIKADYEKQLQFLQKQLDEAKAYCSKKDQTVGELQIQVEKLSIQLEEKREELANVTKQRKDQQKSNSEKTERELNNAYVEITSLQDKNFSLSQENKKFIELVANQKKDLEKSQETSRKLAAEVSQLKNELSKKGNKPIFSQKEKDKEESLVFIRKSLKDLHFSTKNLVEDLESRIEVIKTSEFSEKSGALKKAYENDLVEIRDKLKEIMFFKDIAEGAAMF